MWVVSGIVCLHVRVDACVDFAWEDDDTYIWDWLGRACPNKRQRSGSGGVMGKGTTYCLQPERGAPLPLNTPHGVEFMYALVRWFETYLAFWFQATLYPEVCSRLQVAEHWVAMSQITMKKPSARARDVFSRGSELQVAIQAELVGWRAALLDRASSPSVQDNGMWFCPMCPCRTFSSKQRLQDHVVSVHSSLDRGTPSTKQQRVMQALWDLDQRDHAAWVLCQSSASPPGTRTYLQRSAKALRAQLQDSPSWIQLQEAPGPRSVLTSSAHFDEHVSLLLDGRDTRFFLKVDGGHYHKVGRCFCTHRFLTLVFSACIHPDTRGKIQRVMQHVRAQCGWMSFFVPPHFDFWHTLREEIFAHSRVASMIGLCRVQADTTVLAIDGQYSSVLNVLYQVPHGRARSSTPSDVTDIHTMLTVTCPDGVLDIVPSHSEGFPDLRSALLRSVGDGGTGRTRLIASDSPCTLDVPALFVEFPALECVAGDPLHVVLRVEKSSAEKKTRLSKGLRVCTGKLRAGFEDGQPYFRHTMVVPEHVGLDSEFASMGSVWRRFRSTRIFESREYADLPYTRAADFVRDIAALAQSFPEQMPRKTKNKTTVYASLCESFQPRNLEYLLNYGRFVARNSNQVVPYGTTSNEAFHNELKGCFSCVLHMTQRYVVAHARVISGMKLIAGFLKKQNFTRVYEQAALVRSFCARLQEEALDFSPLLRFDRRPNPIVDVDSLDAAAKRLRKRPTAVSLASTAKASRKRLLP